nr:hypothetical protein [Actinomadura sp. K4S16]
MWWITADTAAAVQAGLAGLAAALQPELKTALELEALAERGLAWLGCHSGWLVVLDNVTDPAHIASLLDRTMRGRVLVTSRLGQGWHRYGARVLRLDVLTEDQAVELLTQIAAPEGADGAGLDGAAELVAELGCLPLAVEQAAAYLHQNQLSPRQYLDLLAASLAVMYHEAAEGSATGTGTGGEAASDARIWRITLNRITTDTPLAGELLRILVWYAPEAIPRTCSTASPMLAGAQAVEMAFVDGRLTNPVAQARLADAQTLGQRGDRLVAGPGQFDGATPELRRVRWWHETLPSQVDQGQLRSGVRGTGGSSLRQSWS